MRGVCALLTLGLAALAQADSFQVYPVRVDLDAAHPNAVVTLVNPTDEAILIQAETFDWEQADGQDQLQPSHALLVNPPIFELPAHGKQLLRVGLRQGWSQGVGSEKGWRLWLSQLPARMGSDPTDAQVQAVKVLLRVNLPVFAAAHARAAVSSPQWRWQLGVLSAHNAGSRHVQLKQVQISDADGNHLQLGMRYVLAGAEAAWTLPDAWRDRAIKVDADSDGGPLSVSLDATRLDAVLPETLRLDTTRAARGTFDAASAAHP